MTQVRSDRRWWSARIPCVLFHPNTHPHPAPRPTIYLPKNERLMLLDAKWSTETWSHLSVKPKGISSFPPQRHLEFSKVSCPQIWWENGKNKPMITLEVISQGQWQLKAPTKCTSSLPPPLYPISSSLFRTCLSMKQYKNLKLSWLKVEIKKPPSLKMYRFSLSEKLLPLPFGRGLICHRAIYPCLWIYCFTFDRYHHLLGIP